MQNQFTKPAEDLASGAMEYVDRKVDELKLRTVKGLSLTLSKVLVATMMISLGTIVLMASAFGGVLLLGDLIGSYAAGAFIIAGVFLIALIVLFLVRKKLFVNGFIKLFLALFFDEENAEEVQK